MPDLGDPWKRIPEPVRAALERLAAAGFQAALVGGCVRDLISSRAVHDWDATSDADPEDVLAIFSRAVPIGLKHGTVMVPTRAGPVDITRHRAGSLAADLDHRDFTCNAMALPLGASEVLDPHQGSADLAAGLLRAVGDPGERLAEDPLRALRAARFVACAGMQADPALVRAMREVSLAGIAVERQRAEVERLLLGAEVGAALELLGETGLLAQLFPGAPSDAARVVPRVPAELGTRLAACLRGTESARVLARLRFSNARAHEVSRLLGLHPIDTHASATGPSLRRVLRRVGDAGLDALLALRRAECATGSAGPEIVGRLDALESARAALAREGHLALVRGDLAIDGAGVMRALGSPAGPTVGRALAYLTECVLDDPACNTEAGLRDKLAAWSDPGPQRR